ncbi:MAG TPA: C1 family peptidase [Planctomycetaceae bacterium]|jgi:hypothetical protein
MKSWIMLLAAFAASVFVALPSAIVAADRPIPKQVDLRSRFAKFGLTPRAQGARDTCSAFALTGVAEYEMARSGSGRSPRLSEEYLVWGANDATGLTGDQATFIEALQGLTRLGICTATAMPYEAQSDQQRSPTAAAREEAGRHGHWSAVWIKRWNVNRGMTPAELTAIKTELANDHPVAISLRWPQEPRLSPINVLERPPAAEIRDGHSVVLAGYQDDPNNSASGLFIVRNSDGPGWGVEGYAYITYGYAAEYCNEALALRHDSAAAGAARFQVTARFEAESLKIVKTSPRCLPEVRDMHDWGSKQWGAGKQLYCAAENGGSLELEYEVPEEGRFEIFLYLTLAPDFGRLKILIDGRVLTRQPDGFCGRVEPSGPLSLGIHDLKQGPHRLIVATIGKNDLSAGHSFGIDAFELFPRR